MKKICLTIAGSDSSGGAGIQADIKAMEANGVFAMTVITGITSQNSHAITGIKTISAKMIQKQIEALFEDYQIDSVKIGALFNKNIIKVVAKKIKESKIKNIVLDPVMVSKSKVKLINNKAIGALIKEFKNSDVLITPNLPEAEILTSTSIKNIKEMQKAISILSKMGFNSILLKGGHLPGEKIIDILFDKKQNIMKKFISKKIKTKNTHGTGCTLSSSIAANLALNNGNLLKAVENSINYVHKGIEKSLNIGKGNGPLNHFVK